MYSVFLDDAQILLEYLDVFSGELPILKDEIGLLNMHKAISIICELIVEAKGFSVLLDCMIKNEKIENNNKKLFISPVLQADSFLAAAITKHCSIKGIQEAFIVSVTLDSINAVPEYYNAIHTTINAKKSCNATKYFFNFNIEEYEMLMFLMEQNYDVFSILSDYFCNDSLKPFSSYIQDKHKDIDMTVFMERIFQEASKKMKEMLFS